MNSILLVEPDLLLGQTYREFLIRHGYQVDWQQTVASAIQSLDNQTIDLVILELQIAGHNGLEFLYEMRSYQDWLEIPVIINSFVLQDSANMSLDLEQLGIKHYLYKPEVTLKQLLAHVEASLQKVSV